MANCPFRRRPRPEYGSGSAVSTVARSSDWLHSPVLSIEIVCLGHSNDHRRLQMESKARRYDIHTTSHYRRRCKYEPQDDCPCDRSSSCISWRRTYTPGSSGRDDRVHVLLLGCELDACEHVESCWPRTWPWVHLERSCTSRLWRFIHNHNQCLRGMSAYIKWSSKAQAGRLV